MVKVYFLQVLFGQVINKWFTPIVYDAKLKNTDGGRY